MIGKTLGHYQSIEKLAEGGMSEVYRATGQKLGREVALMALLEGFAVGYGCAQEPRPATRLQWRHRRRN